MLPFLTENPTSLELSFWLCAMGGTLFFLLRVLLAISSGFGADDLDTGHDSHDIHHDGDVAFKLISLNTVSAFIMMFGWGGLTAYQQFQLGSVLSFFVALVVGCVFMYLIGYIFLLGYKLRSEGADFKIEDTVGKRAKVYQKIPSDGRGKIQITVGDMLQEIEAESEGLQELESFTSVVVTKVLGAMVVQVRPADE